MDMNTYPCEWPKTHVRKISTLLVIIAMQIKTKYYFIPPQIVKIIKFNNINGVQEPMEILGQYWWK